MRPALYVLLGVLLVPTVGLVGDIVTDGTFISTAVPGIAPLQVESTDRVDNLNADMLDGISGDQLFLRSEVYTKAEVDALIAAAAAADSRRWYYLTTTTHQGDDALTACDSGFHMASIYEILDVSNVRYDTVRGKTWADSGSGPAQYVFGWVRTGDDAHTGNTVGYANCNAWTSSSASHYGTMVRLEDPAAQDWNSAATRMSPWQGASVFCSLPTWVWCIED